MANTYVASQTVTTTIDGVRSSLSTNNTTYVTSSNFIVGGQAVTASAWTSLSLGSLTDVIGLSIYNDNTLNTASVITVATGSAGQNVLGILIPGAQSTIAWSGSISGLYAKVTGGYPFGASTPNNGTVQWIAQQS